MEKDKKVERIVMTLNNAFSKKDAKDDDKKKYDDTKKYYVYMLLANNEPFYVGKGTGDRLLQHEKDADTIDDSWTEEITKKIAIIKEKKGNIEEVIVKWGLTEHEAFMAESALINAFRYADVDLANEVNGHASKPEQNAMNLDGKETAARNLADFLSYVAIPSIRFQDIKIDEGPIQVPICFITADKTLGKATNDDEIYDCVRGYWKLNEKMVKEVKIVVALYRGVIRGVYAVDTDFKWKALSEVKPKEVPIFPQEERKEELLANMNSTYNDYVKNGGTLKLDNFNKIRKRVGFSKVEETEIKNLDKSIQEAYNKLRNFIGYRLEERFFTNQQSYYNFEGTGENIVYYKKETWKK